MSDKDGTPCCDTLVSFGELIRPAKYCRMGGCARKEDGGPECECMKEYNERTP